MASIKLRNSVELSNYGVPYIVAELNTSHFGNIDTAKAMIDRAKESGCDCVKFQSWSEDSLYSKTYYDENPIAKRFVKKFSFSEAELLELSLHCKAVGIAFSSTPYSKSEVDFLIEKCDAPFIKVASMELNNLPYLDFIGRSGAPIVLSTGMGEMDEVDRAVETIEKTGNTALCILHCVAIYPTETSTIRLKNILGLRERFPKYPIGFSDHSLGVEMASAAVALGACLVEKHFTLDQKKIGMDNQMATEPEEMATLVRHCHNVQIAMGGTDRIVMSAELDQRKKMRRSIIAAVDLKAGTKLTEETLDAKRPGTGLPPERLGDLIGRTLLRDVEGGALLTSEDFAE